MAQTTTVKRTASKRKTENPPGVIGKPKSSYVTVQDVMFYLDCSRSKAYDVINGLRQELVNAGRLYDGVSAGRIPKHYFFERCMIDENDYL